MPIISPTDPGTSYTNDTNKILWQYICQWKNSCGLCIQFSNLIGTYWPLPMHIGCNCVQVAIRPGQTADPYIDFQAEIHKLQPKERARVVGVANWTLIDKGIVKWEDVVTKARIKDFREVVAEQDLSVKRLVRVGVPKSVAQRAHDTTHTPAHDQAEKQRQTLARALRGHGLTDEQIRAALSERLGSRVTTRRGPDLPERPWTIGPYGPNGGPFPPPKPKPTPPPPPPPKPIPKPKPVKPRPKPPGKPVAHPPAPVPAKPTVEPVRPDIGASRLSEFREIVARELPRVQETAKAAKGRLDDLIAQAESAVARRKKLDEEFAPSDQIIAAYKEVDRLRSEVASIRGEVDRAVSRAERLEKWEENRKILPNLIPPIETKARMELYTEGDRKVAAISDLDRLAAEKLGANASAREELRQKWIELDRWVRAREFLKLPKKQQAEFEANKAEAERMLAELQAGAVTVEKIRKETRKMLHDIIKVDDDIAAVVHFDASKAGDHNRGRADEAATFLRGKLARGDDGEFRPTVQDIPANEPQRDYCAGDAIHSKQATSTSVTVHESGHAIDYAMTLGGDRAGISTRDFLTYRVGDEKSVSLREKFPDHGYEPWELGRSDDFGKLFDDRPSSAYYTGKVYPGDHLSEVMAMGLQHLYDDPVAFARKDPEYLKFILGMLDGSLR